MSHSKAEDRPSLILLIETIARCLYEIGECHQLERRRNIPEDGEAFRAIVGAIARLEKSSKILANVLKYDGSRSVSELESMVSCYFSVRYSLFCLKKLRKFTYNTLWGKDKADNLYDQNKYKGMYVINAYEESGEFISSFENARDFASFFGISVKAARGKISYVFPGHEGWSEKTTCLNRRKVILEFIIDDEK